MLIFAYLKVADDEKEKAIATDATVERLEKVVVKKKLLQNDD